MRRTKASMKPSTMVKVGVVCLVVNGLIFLFYALLVPVVVSGVHWLITLAALLFLFALPAIYQSFHKVPNLVAKAVVLLLGLAMTILILSDVLFALSVLSGVNHDMAYALGSGVFILCVLAVGVLALKGAYFKWLGDLSILTGVVGLLTYVVGGGGFLPILSLMLLGLWSLAFGLNIR